MLASSVGRSLRTAAARASTAAPRPTTTTAARRANIQSRQLPTTTSSRPFSSSPATMVVHNIASKAEFDSTLKDNEIVVVDFFATWCGPCKMVAPVLVEYSEKYSKARFVKVDVDELSDVAQEYSIRAMPTFVVLKNGEKVETVMGANPPAIEAAISKYAA